MHEGRIEFTHTEAHGFEHAIRGMRHPFKVTDKGDSQWGVEINEGGFPQYRFVIGPKDKDLCIRLNRAGSPHNKFLREIVCWVDINAPRFWWQEMDTYRFGVEKDSESTMHTIMKHPFSPDDFAGEIPEETIASLNRLRILWDECEDTEKKADIWRELINVLPQSYMQKRTVMMSYAAIRSICHQREGHKLDEWKKFIRWAHTLPHNWLLFDEEDKV